MYLDKIEPLYVEHSTLRISTKDTQEVLILLPDDSVANASRSIADMRSKDGVFDSKGVTSVYLPMRLKFRVGNLRVSDMVPSSKHKEIMKEITEFNPPVKKYFTTKMGVGKNSVFVIPVLELTKIQNGVTFNNADKVISVINLILRDSISDFKKHKQKVVLFDLANFPQYKTPSAISNTLFKKHQDMYSLFLWVMKYQPETFVSFLNRGITFIISSRIGAFYFEPKDIMERGFIENYFTSIKKIETEDVMDEPDIVDINAETGDVIVEEVDVNEVAELKDVHDLIDGTEMDEETTKTILDTLTTVETGNEDKLIRDKEMKAIKETVLKRGNVTVGTFGAREKRVLKEHVKREHDIDEMLADKKLNTVKEESFDNVTDVAGFDVSENFNRNLQYEEDIKDAEIEKYLRVFATTDTPLVLDKMTKKPSNSTEDYVDDYQFTFIDVENNSKHTFTMAIPKLYHGNTLHLGNGDKVLQTQILPPPILKLGEKVVISTNYKKVFIANEGKYSSKYAVIIDRLVKLLIKEEHFVIGSGLHSVLLDFEDYPFGLVEMSKRFNKATYKSSLDIDLTSITKVGDNYKIGTYNKSDVLVVPQTETVIYEGDEYPLEEFIKDMLVDVFSKEYPEEVAKAELKPSNKSVYSSRLVILGKKVPIIYIMMIESGIYGALDQLKRDNKLEYSTMMKQKDGQRPPVVDEFESGVITLKDRFIIVTYNDDTNISILSPLVNDTDIKDEPVDEMINSPNDYIDQQVGRINFSLEIQNFLNLMIDTKTEQKLKEMGLPVVFTELLVYATHLLRTGYLGHDTDMSDSRLRHADIIPATVYNVMATHYQSYVMAKKRGSSSAQFSVPRNAVVKTMVTMNTVEEQSVVNPVYEMSNNNKASMKGLLILKLDMSYPNLAAYL